MLLQEQLARMAEGDPVRAHHPVDHRAAGIAPEAVPEIGLRRHDAARGLIPLVPGTAAGQVLALRDEFPWPSIRRARETSRFNRSSAPSGMRAIRFSLKNLSRPLPWIFVKSERLKKLAQ